MAFLIITPMLGFVVDMLNTDRREQIKASTEQDIQAAVDFIAQDLSQAIYIYDNNPATTSTANTTPTGIPAIIGNFIPSDATKTPILVFWKRQQLKNSLPIAATEIPRDCIANTLSGSGACNDTYVLALVAYYQESGSPGIWCQPSGAPCPSRIVRYQIKDGLRNPNSPNVDYFSTAEVSPGQERNPAFNQNFDLSKPTDNVTTRNLPDFLQNAEVLVNYIDHSQKPIDAEECQKALGYPTTQTGNTTARIPEETLRVTETGSTPNPTPKGFYACVDTARNIARVTIRGNSLRRLQPNNADYDDKKSAYFPTASVQVQGLGARGK